MLLPSTSNSSPTPIHNSQVTNTPLGNICLHTMAVGHLQRLCLFNYTSLYESHFPQAPSLVLVNCVCKLNQDAFYLIVHKYQLLTNIRCSVHRNEIFYGSLSYNISKQIQPSSVFPLLKHMWQIGCTI